MAVLSSSLDRRGFNPKRYIRVWSPAITNHNTRQPSPYGRQLGLGIVCCATEYQEIPIGTVVVGGAIAVVAIVLITNIDAN